MEHNQFHNHVSGTTHPVIYDSRSYLLDLESCEICSLAENEDELVLCDLCNSLYHKYCINMKELPPASWICTACKMLLIQPVQGQVSPSNNNVITID